MQVTIPSGIDPGNAPGCDDASDGVQLMLLQMVLDQVDYGLAVVHLDTRRVRFANALAHAALRPAADAQGRLHVAGEQLRASGAADTLQLERALTQARGGVRALLRLNAGGRMQSIALVPLSLGGASSHPQGEAGQPGPPAAFAHALLVFAKQQLCDGSTITLFARERGLTSMEGQVLASVCRGLRPNQIASQHGVQISTVRTQLRSIRHKTQTDTIRELVQQVSVLPPMARQFHAGFASAMAAASAPA